MGIEKYFYIGAVILLIGSCVMMKLSKEKPEDIFVPDINESVPVIDIETSKPDIVETPPEIEEPEPDNITIETEPVEIDLLSEYEALCDQDIPSEASLVQETKGRAFSKTYFMPDGSKTGPAYIWYDDSQAQIRSFLCYNEDGEKHGPAVYWEDNGDHESEYFYVNDSRDGSFKEWEDGVLIEQRTYSMGTLNGEYKTWFDDGTLETLNVYTDGEKNGKWITYYDNGNVKEEYNYELGIKQANFRIFYEDSTLQSERNGVLKASRFTGYIVNYGKIIDGQQTGSKCEFVEDFKISCEEVTR